MSIIFLISDPPTLDATDCLTKALMPSALLMIFRAQMAARYCIQASAGVPLGYGKSEKRLEFFNRCELP